nr:zinc finger BED domain-containing protein RICESLEEPER 2-like [Setaria viridis]
MLRVRAAGHAPLFSAEHPSPVPLRRPPDASRFAIAAGDGKTGAGALDQASLGHGHELSAYYQDHQERNADGASSHRRELGKFFACASHSARCYYSTAPDLLFELGLLQGPRIVEERRCRGDDVNGGGLEGVFRVCSRMDDDYPTCLNDELRLMGETGDEILIWRRIGGRCSVVLSSMLSQVVEILHHLLLLALVLVRARRVRAARGLVLAPLSVVAHYVNVDWQLEKRILGLRLIDVSHNADNIAERITAVATDYGLNDKIFSITLDNASANTAAIGKLHPSLTGYMGKLFFHQRCACHIINLIVKAGLNVFKPMLSSFRTAISFLNCSNQRIAAYKSYCIVVGVRPRKFALDMDVRWNSTYLMLKHLLPHKTTFHQFITTQYGLVEGQTILTELHWYIAEKILIFLEQFYDSTVILSGVYYPTAPLILHHILEIAGHLNFYANDADLKHIVAPMKSKFLDYWSGIPMLYAFAFILDPRAKITGFSNVLQLMSQLTGKDYSSYLTDVRAELSTIFGKYEAKYGSVRMHRATQPGPAGKKKTAWGKIFGSQAASSTYSAASLGAGLGSTSVSSSLSRRQSASALLQAAQTESAFSTTGRIIEERRRRLTPEMVEILALIKDWEQGDARLQHTVNDTELEESFEDLYLDES